MDARADAVNGEVTDPDELEATDVFLDLLGRSDVTTLRMLCELGGPLTAMLAAWAADVREEPTP